MRTLWLLPLLVGCRITGEFHCERNEQCVEEGAPGLCVSGSCAFGDPACLSGWRYGDSATSEVAGACFEAAAPVDCGSWSPRHFTPCALPAPLGPLRLAGGNFLYDTDRGEFIGTPDVPHTSIVLPQPDGTSARIISAAGFSLEGDVTLRVVGSHPLIIASWSDLTVTGTIDVSSATGDLRGAGSGGPACDGKAGEPGAATLGGGGGGGGGFAGAGGAGALGDRDQGVGRAGGAGGAAISLPTANVRGGCDGGSGGAIGPAASAPFTATTAARGGAGGGAIQLTARGKLTVTGTIHASGAGGEGGPGQEGGGGGGGAGGYIGLEGAMVSLSGTFAANGGGGGAGAYANAGNPGNSGTATNNRAAGGQQAVQCQGPGGRGSSAAVPNGDAALTDYATCGGGGGGGGVGVLGVRTPAFTMTNTTFSPAPTFDPS